MKFNFVNLDQIDSTNEYVKRNVENLTDGTVVTAKIQTNGKGRMGRRFISPDGGIYMTLVLKDVDKKNFEFITPMTAVAVAETIAPFANGKVEIKWVNDVLINGKKVCGILCESQFCGEKLQYVAVGIGINVSVPKNGFDKDIEDTATALTETETIGFKEIIITAVINRFAELYDNFDIEYVLNQYRKRDSLVGKNVMVKVGDDIITGIATGINDKFNLLVKTSTKIMTISSGTLNTMS